MRDHLSLVPGLPASEQTHDTVVVPGVTIRAEYEAPPARPSFTLTVSGELDGVGGPLLQTAWDTCVANLPHDVRLDLRGVEYCNAAGLRVLAGIIAGCRQRGLALQLLATRVVTRLLHLTGLDVEPDTSPADRPADLGARFLQARALPVPDRDGQLGAGTRLPSAPSVTGVAARDVAGVTSWAPPVARGHQAEIVYAMVSAAEDGIAGVDSVQVSLWTDARSATPAACTGPLGDRMADAESASEEGPAWQSRREAGDVHVGDLWSADARLRWPRLSEATQDLPVRSVMCLHLGAPSHPLGTLTLTSARPSAFGESAQGLAGALAAVATVTLDGERLRRQLTEALSGRDVIGQAKGILMERHRLTAEQAFEVLRSASVGSNTKLRRVAARVAETGEV